MSLIAFPFARYGRAAAAIATAVLLCSQAKVLAQAPAPASAQAPRPAGSPATPDKSATTPATPTEQTQPATGPAEQTQAPATGPVVRDIRVRGTQRIESGTVLSYMSIRPGDRYDPQVVDRSLKTLFATGLFADVKINWDGSVLTVNVVENPIINRVIFEGESKVSEKDLTKEVQLKPRMVFTRAKVQGDVERVIELYRRNGKFAATVDPQVIQRPQNRVDLIFSITEGPTTGVARISFIGNKVFDDATLKGQIATEESAWWRFLSSNDNYDPDRLTFDREQLRRFYLKNGYADFRVVSAVAELTPDRRDFYIVFTVDEGALYRFGKIVINSKIRELYPASLRPLVPIVSGRTYNAELVDKSIDALTNAAGAKGYAFAEIHPRIARNKAKRTIDVVFDIEQGPRVYVEKINIVGNTRTLDKVIRREIRLVEGDAFNRVLVDRSRTRIRSLGFFKDVDIKPAPGSQPDRTVLNVNVTEQSTGELQLGVGYSSTSSFVGQFSYTERNLFGRAQYLRASVSASSISKEAVLSFTEPYFLDRPIAAGFDIYKILTDFQQADYRSDTNGIGLRLGFPTSEYGSVGVRYTFRLDSLTPFSGAPTAVLLAIGSETTSSIGYTYAYNTLDDPIKPRHGVTFQLSQDFAGLGGSLDYMKTTASFSYRRPVLWDEFVATFTVNGGYITGYGGQHVRLNERFFEGGDTFRGFEVAGVGPRELHAGRESAIGGEAYALGTMDLRLPDFLPADYGISLSLFTDFGTVGHIASQPGVPTCGRAGPRVPCIEDDMAFRGSGGLAIGWKSPFGPIEVDLAVPYAKTAYDKSQIIRFSAGTGTGF
ncbi:MAG TPA: outer membrane protein assembly factor BamA [Rhizomicrobium sp.]|nr:outer membrane protein assembly factor BamA [Rhizomicrobium sp.]